MSNSIAPSWFGVWPFGPVNGHAEEGGGEGIPRESPPRALATPPEPTTHHPKPNKGKATTPLPPRPGSTGETEEAAPPVAREGWKRERDLDGGGKRGARDKDRKGGMEVQERVENGPVGKGTGERAGDQDDTEEKQTREREGETRVKVQDKAEKGPWDG